jgi:aminopeptidase N
MRLIWFSVALLLGSPLVAQAPRPHPEVWSSGGRLIPEQAAYDVTHYDLTLRVSPNDSTIEGTLAVRLTTTQSLDWLVLDLDSALTVRSARPMAPDSSELAVERRNQRIWIRLRRRALPGSSLGFRVAYGGRPRIAVRPPWIGGFQWARTPSGAPWIATTCVNEGADLWWPVKDHPSDKADSVGLHITVPAGLVVATNGQPRGHWSPAEGWTTFDWMVTTPISNYNVALNIAPYDTVSRTYTSVTGETFPVTYWVLPENRAKGEQLMKQILAHLRFYEELLGPYPFRADKYGVAETPHLGMELQTIIAYGNQYRLNAEGYDELHQHELAHEWFANLITARDWSDYWLHEGFGSHFQPLYAEKLHGPEAYRRVIARLRSGIKNRHPVAPRAPLTAAEVYFEPPDYLESTGDIYSKGALVLHTLRGLVGDSAFFPILRRFVYPTEALERVTDGSQVRLVDTDEFIGLAERISGRSLGWFFEVYLRQPVLPRLISRRSGETLELEWIVPGGRPFPMPVEVEIGGQRRRIELPNGRVQVTVPAGAAVRIDPDQWILKASDRSDSGSAGKDKS